VNVRVNQAVFRLGHSVQDRGAGTGSNEFTPANHM